MPFCTGDWPWFSKWWPTMDIAEPMLTTKCRQGHAGLCNAWPPINSGNQTLSCLYLYFGFCTDCCSPGLFLSADKAQQLWWENAPAFFQPYLVCKLHIKLTSVALYQFTLRIAHTLVVLPWWSTSLVRVYRAPCTRGSRRILSSNISLLDLGKVQYHFLIWFNLGMESATSSILTALPHLRQ